MFQQLAPKTRLKALQVPGLHRQPFAGRISCQSTGQAFSQHTRQSRVAIPGSHDAGEAGRLQASRSVSCAAQRREESSFKFQRRDQKTEVEFGQTRVVLADDQLWMLALPVAALVMAATVIGPLVIGLAFSAVAVGAVVSAGALAFSTLFLPMFMFMGFGAMMMSGLGVALFFPKVLSLGVAALGLGVGWGVVSLLGGSVKKVMVGGSSSSSSAASSRQDAPASYSGRGSSTRTIDVEPSGSGSSGSEPAVDQEVMEQSRQLREFDDLLAERDEARRMERWRSMQGGQGGKR